MVEGLEFNRASFVDQSGLLAIGDSEDHQPNPAAGASVFSEGHLDGATPRSSIDAIIRPGWRIKRPCLIFFFCCADRCRPS